MNRANMDLTKLRIPVVLVVGALGAAVGFGGSIAVAKDRAAQTELRVEKLEEKTERDRLDVRELQTLVRETAETVKYIRRKLDKER